jgi:hypothetical protein
MKCRVFLVAVGISMFSGAIAADPISLAKPVPFSEGAIIAQKIKNECSIQTQLADFVAEYAKEKGIEIAFSSEVNKEAAGRVLDLEIRDAISDGNPFIGHRKSTTVSGKLYDNGELIGNFVARRNSMGGAFAGYKGSCSVLGRTVKVLGQDIAGWLTAPSKDAQLGDLG